MNREKRVLVVDDEAKWIKSLSRKLRSAGYSVTTASSIEQAQARLKEDFYHLLVLDISMAPGDKDNVEGLGWLALLDKSGLTDAFAIVMISAYGTTDKMRAAFHHRVFDFLDKNEFKKGAEFLDVVARVFKQQATEQSNGSPARLNALPVNLELEIYWQQGKQQEQAVANLEFDGKRVRRNPELQKRLAAELEDLLCRLFHNAERLLVESLGTGHSKGAVLKIHPSLGNAGVGQAVVMKFGDCSLIAREYRNFKEHVEDFLGGSRNTNIKGWRRTQMLGGIVYSFLGVTGDQFESFGSFYQRAGAAQIEAVIDNLFQETCGRWYANLGTIHLHNLTEDYQQLLGFDFATLEKNREDLKSVQGREKLLFKDLARDRKFTNPVLAAAREPVFKPTYIVTTHGDFNENNILLDQAANTWLIDFGATGQGHILRDVAKLDSVIRFQLLGENDATLAERLSMEEALCSLKRFSEVEQLPERFASDNPAVAKAFTVASHLLSRAHKLVAQNPQHDIKEYYAALLFNALNTIRFYSLPNIQRQHALLSASLLADRLGLKA